MDEDAVQLLFKDLRTAEVVYRQVSDIQKELDSYDKKLEGLRRLRDKYEKDAVKLAIKAVTKYRGTEFVEALSLERKDIQDDEKWEDEA